MQLEAWREFTIGWTGEDLVDEKRTGALVTEQKEVRRRSVSCHYHLGAESWADGQGGESDLAEGGESHLLLHGDLGLTAGKSVWHL